MLRGLFYEAIFYLFYVLPCVILFLFFSPFSTAITSLREERANLSVFRAFVRFAFAWFCLFPIPLGVCEGLRFVILALPGLFSYLVFLNTEKHKNSVRIKAPNSGKASKRKNQNQIHHDDKQGVLMAKSIV